MTGVPLLRPRLPSSGELAPYLDEMNSSGQYSNFGPLNSRFETRVVGELFGGVGAVTTVNNATSGLMLALAECRAGRRIAVMPSFTFAATPLAARWAGLEPYFVDVRGEDWCLDSYAVADAIYRFGQANVVVVPYATFGVPMPLDYYARLVESGVPVVVDAAASLGSRSLDGHHFGEGFPGTIVFSMHATKTFGIGEGGLVYSANPDRIARIRQLANFGFDTDRTARELGLNAKLPEVEAAVALAVLDAFPARVARREQLAAQYIKQLDENGVFVRGYELQRAPEGIVRQFFPLLSPPGGSGAPTMALREAGVEVRHYFAPACHRHSAFAGCSRDSLPVTEELERRIMSLPFWDDLDQEALLRIARALP